MTCRRPRCLAPPPPSDFSSKRSPKAGNTASVSAHRWSGPDLLPSIEPPLAEAPQAMRRPPPKAPPSSRRACGSTLRRSARPAPTAPSPYAACPPPARHAVAMAPPLALLRSSLTQQTHARPRPARPFAQPPRAQPPSARFASPTLPSCSSCTTQSHAHDVCFNPTPERLRT